jgi:hypothetical protein
MNIHFAIKAYERLRDDGTALSENARIALAVAALMAPEGSDVESTCRWVKSRIDPAARMPVCALAGET